MAITGNPVLDQMDPQEKRQKILALQTQNTMGTQAPQLGALRQPAPAPQPEPGPISLQAPSAPTPQIGTPKPAVSLAPQPAGTLEGDKQRYSQEAGKKPVLEDVYGKIRHSSFGENHPKIGALLGTLAQIPATAADIGTTFVPRLGALTPGTSFNKQVQLRGLQNRIASEAKNANEEAQAAYHQAQIPLAQAQTEEAETRARNLPQQLQASMAEHGYRVNAEGKLEAIPESELTPMQQGQVAGGNPELATYRALVNMGMKPDEALREIEKSKALGLRQPNLQQITVRGPDGKPHTYGVNEKGEKVVDYGEHYEKPITINTVPEKTFEYSDKALATIAKPIEEISFRMGRLKQTLEQGSPQADALVAPELLTVMAGGQGSGLRMNEAEIARIVGGRSVWENLKANIQHWNIDPQAARTITPDQDQQIRKLINSVDEKIQKKLAILHNAQSQLTDIQDAKTQHKLVADTRKALDDIDNGVTGEKPNEGDTKTNSSGDKIVFHNGKWGPG